MSTNKKVSAPKTEAMIEVQSSDGKKIKVSMQEYMYNKKIST